MIWQRISGENPGKTGEIGEGGRFFAFHRVIYFAKKTKEGPSHRPRSEASIPWLEVREPMAVKKSKPADAAAKKAPATKSTIKPGKSASAKPKAAAPAVASDTASKAETPKAAPKKAAAAPKKAAAPVKLTDRQLEFLKQIHSTKEEGYLTAKKAEQKTIETLLDKKLIKKGAKDKTSGHFRYTVSKAGEKHLSTVSPA